MLNRDTIRRYFEALSTRNGELAASLFAEGGVIDDFRGGHHAGRAAIEAFIDRVPPLALDMPSPPIEEAPRVTAYGRILYPGLDPVLVRWVFTAEGERIAHLCNSRIEAVPAGRLPAG